MCGVNKAFTIVYSLPFGDNQAENGKIELSPNEIIQIWKMTTKITNYGLCF